ncbi:HEAT repeat domain-containing protein [Micromonospora sp. FIMYZ51]|uniref:HEAT repeat domain-containing protein n=1 Tax=Micromonospora sp. FIMYZ51 TaxID=3051832 RepID=UPI00311E2738
MTDANGETQRLIHESLVADNPERLINELVTSGPDALQQVLAAAHTKANRYLPSLYEVVRRSTYPAAVPVLQRNVDIGNYATVSSVLWALAHNDEASALDIALQHLTDPGALFTTRAAAASALYGVKQPAATQALHATLAEQQTDPDNPELPLLLVNTATALATTNDHSGAPALYRLMESDHETARSLATTALRIVIDQDALRQLATALADPSAEVRGAAVDPVFLIGSPAAAELLLRRAEDDSDDTVRHNSLLRFGDILGLALGGLDDLSFAQDEWATTRSELDQDVCYRFGEAITLENLVEEFTEEEQLRERVAEELQIVTGIDVPSIFKQGGIDAVRIATAEASIRPGRVHKWGYAQPLPQR